MGDVGPVLVEMDRVTGVKDPCVTDSVGTSHKPFYIGYLRW